MTEDATPTSTVDSDRVLDIDALPEKKKIKVHRGQLALSSASINDDVDVHSKSSTLNMEIGKSGTPTPQGHEAHASSYNPYLSPRPKEGSVVAATATATATATVTGSMQKVALPAESYSLSKLVVYSLVCVPLSAVYVPLSLLLLVAFLALPPLAPSVVRVLDTLSDSDLRSANSSCIERDARRVLSRLSVDQASAGGRKMFRYHASSAVWSRFAYFVCLKLLVSMVALVPTLVLSVLSLLVFPIRPLSTALKESACSCALWTREYTRSSIGKPLAGATAAQQEDAAEVV